MPMIDHEYECTMKGHEGGSRTFTKAPPEWFQDKGFSLPNKCDECRDWIKSQTDELRSCTCGAAIRIRKQRKISIFKRVGPYEPITKCLDCLEGREPPKAARKPRDTRQKIREDELSEERMSFKSLPVRYANEPRRLALATAPEYQETCPTEVGTKEPRWVHVLHHVPGSAHSLTDRATARQEGYRKEKSISHLAENVTTFPEYIENVEPYMLATTEHMVREYRSDGNIVRVSFLGSLDELELTVLMQRSDGAHVVITSHNKIKIERINNMVNERWS